MDRTARHEEKNIRRDLTLFLVILFSIVLFMSNLIAIVDCFLHPEIPYFAQDHFAVGGINGVVCGILFCLTVLCTNNGRQTVLQGGTLKAILPICANCKQVRVSDTYTIESWQPLECYITEHTATQFSHGCCPDCMEKLYPGFATEIKNHHIQTRPELSYI
ncbi:MAG: hypothetical protein ACD_75C00519G0003 [uncultured bacterium]|nr:MAG: hypothetical protein ACD_75C00519G0003 [uncultured bacterium]